MKRLPTEHHKNADAMIEKILFISGNIPQEMIASHIGVTQATISNWLGGKSKPSKPMLARVAPSVDLLMKICEVKDEN